MIARLPDAINTIYVSTTSITMAIVGTESNPDQMVTYRTINPEYRRASVLGRTLIQQTATDRLNATSMCNSEGRRFEEFLQTRVARDTLQRLRQTTDDEDLMQTILDGPKEVHGNYVHEDIALQAAIWCSREMGYAVSKIIDDRIAHARIIKERVDFERLRHNEALMLEYGQPDVRHRIIQGDAEHETNAHEAPIPDQWHSRITHAAVHQITQRSDVSMVAIVTSWVIMTCLIQTLCGYNAPSFIAIAVVLAGLCVIGVWVIVISLRCFSYVAAVCADCPDLKLTKNRAVSRRMC